MIQTVRQKRCHFATMSLLIQTVIVYFLLVYFHHFGHCSATGTRPLFQLKGDIAKGKFCRQKSFDSVAFDGRNYRFSVTRRDIARDHITFELFLLNYNTTSDSFQYSSATFDNDNGKIFNYFSLINNHFFTNSCTIGRFLFATKKFIRGISRKRQKRNRSILLRSHVLTSSKNMCPD